MAGPSVNLLAHLRPEQVRVTVAGRPFILTATTANQWLGALAMDLDNLGGIMPGLVADEDLAAMDELIAGHPDIETRWLHAARTALGRAAGRDWWWALNLSKQALGTWIYMNGILLRQNVNSKNLGFADWLDACYTLFWENADEEHRIQLDMRLSLPPRGVALGSRSSRQMAMDFAAD